MVDSRRTLVREVLLSQLAFAGLVGVVAIASVWWVSNWVVRDNLDDWAVRWVGEMESLAGGFYLNSNDERFLELERYLSRFPEIEYVRYYDLAGEQIYLESASETEPRLYPALEPDAMAELAGLAAAGRGERYLMDLTLEPLVRISQAVSKESIVSANLFNARSLDELESETTVVGFVELGLDYSAYDRELLGGVSTGSAIIGFAFLLLVLMGRFTLRRAVQPLSDMQVPLGRIAQGDLEVEVPPSSHQEIAAVGEALQTALEKIRERDQHLTKLANFDSLTGLVSRHHFMDQLTERLRGFHPIEARGALLFVDMDQFKHVNDTYGHQAGDAMLAQIAERLRQVLRKDDLLGRLGGDEFVIFISDITADDADAVAEKLLHDLADCPLVYDDVSLSANCSIGIAMVEQTSAFNPEELISQADVACRLAKTQGRNRACRYQPDERHIEAIKSDVEWQGKLKIALKDGDEEARFELNFQPILHLADGEVRHYEVLLRLREGETIYLPDQFLPAAIRFGLMCDIDHWVIDRAFETLADLHREQPDLGFAINVTGSAFLDGSLPGYVAMKLKEHRVPASSIILEITEQVAIGSFSETLNQIRALHELGCSFAVDDFGTGYCSLSYLKRLPVQFIKIDGSFCQRLAVNRVDQTIVRSIADIARIMGKQTIAEFVGDAPTLEMVREMGIDYAQGFHVGKPVPAIPPHHSTMGVVSLRMVG
jgi:diguanylate cyclase (GGDEF)-like protein